MTRQGFWKILRGHAVRAEINSPLSPHIVRHSFATHALERGVDSVTVAVLMGHSDPSMLAKVYQHLTQNPTFLLEQARQRGCQTVDGLEMFVRQAARQFELFTGRPAPNNLMRETVRRGMAGRS